ncbi:MAG: hypothetical protein V7K38_25830 [Nostoc sp.]|uniref:hypothetical protein n=1 Tax=Nostoc sp. TaxID=1180 RepID=UPI002FF5C412
MFYSPKDLEYAMGWEKIRKLYLSTTVQQKRNISTPVPITLQVGDRSYSLSIKDMKGWAGTGGLQSLAKSVGFQMTAKSEMDGYKTKMRDGLEAMPAIFAAYAMGDVDDLHEIYKAFVELVRWVQADIIGIPVEDCFTEDNIPMTTGSLVAATLLKWLHTQGANKELMQFAMRKLGLLDTSAVNYDYNLKAYLHATSTYRTTESLEQALSLGQDKLLKQFYQAKYKYLAISQASVNYFAGVTCDSAAFSAIVQGGRCNNERPSEYVCRIGADIDLQSCYGSALRAFIYPLGLPTVWSYRPNQKRPTLRKWLAKNEDNLVDNLWTATVSGDLNFAQDLIYSKLVTQYQINHAALGDWDKDYSDDHRDDDIAHIPGELALIRKQIRNGIITTDVMKTIKSVATNNEIKQLLDMELICAVAYQSCDQVCGVDQWIATVIADKGRLQNKDGLHNNTIDNRTRTWVALPLEGFIGNLVNQRNLLKLVKKSDANEDDKFLADAKQNALKLFVNTCYGVLASPYFAVGNTVVANNITARARVGAWMLNKSLHTRQSITDGGMYSLMDVPVLRDNAKLPGLDLLNDNKLWFDTKNYTRFLQPLAGMDWDIIFQENGNELKQLDLFAKNHIDAFWQRYGLELPFDIEHKLENTFTIATYINKAHYCLVRLEHDNNLTNNFLYRIRGARDYSNDNIRKHPTYQLLYNMACDGDNFPQELTYDHQSLLKINKWLEIQTSNGYQELKELRPGDELIEERTARYNNTHFFCDTVNQFKKRSERKTYIAGKPIEFFERYRQDGIKTVHTQMMLDSLQKVENGKQLKEN